MSIDRECKSCGEEYDIRHGKCPVCGGKSPRARLDKLAKDVMDGKGHFEKLTNSLRHAVGAPIKHIAEAIPENLITEAYLEEHSQLSGVASERVTWEAATATIEEEAAKKFLAGKDTEAAFLRELAKQFREKATDASKRQHVMLKAQGIG